MPRKKITPERKVLDGLKEMGVDPAQLYQFAFLVVQEAMHTPKVAQTTTGGMKIEGRPVSAPTNRDLEEGEARL